MGRNESVVGLAEGMGSVPGPILAEPTPRIYRAQQQSPERPEPVALVDGRGGHQCGCQYCNGSSGGCEGGNADSREEVD